MFTVIMVGRRRKVGGLGPASIIINTQYSVLRPQASVLVKAGVLINDVDE